MKKTGCFPNKERPKVLWLGISGVTKQLDTAVTQFENLFDSCGFPKEEKQSIPHITIARIKYPQKVTPDVNLFLKSTYDPIVFSVDRVQFLSSELLSTGAVYTLIKSFPLGEKL